MLYSNGIRYIISLLVSRARVNALENILSLSDCIAYYNKYNMVTRVRPWYHTCV